MSQFVASEVSSFKSPFVVAMDTSVEFEPSIEDGYLLQLVNEILKFLMLKHGGSLLIMGGKSWNFGQMLWHTSTSPTCVYADSDQRSLDAADEEEALTVCCDLAQSQEVTKLGKYDGIVSKDCLEMNADTLTEFMASVYRILKFNGKAVLVSRLEPTLPLPKTVVDNWRNSMPDLARISAEANELEFGMESRKCKFQVCVEKETYEKVLHRRVWPFMQNVTDSEIDEFLSAQPALMKFEDNFDFILLNKEMID